VKPPRWPEVVIVVALGAIGAFGAWALWGEELGLRGRDGGDRPAPVQPGQGTTTT
jgi:hypothetical protein